MAALGTLPQKIKMDFDYTVDLTIADVYLLYQCVVKRIETWPGGEPREQEHLYVLKSSLYRMILEYNIENL